VLLPGRQTIGNRGCDSRPTMVAEESTIQKVRAANNNQKQVDSQKISIAMVYPQNPDEQKGFVLDVI